MDMAQIDAQEMMLCHYYKGIVPTGATVTGKCRAGARYVMITIPAGALTLCEVEVFSSSSSEGKILKLINTLNSSSIV